MKRAVACTVHPGEAPEMHHRCQILQNFQSIPPVSWSATSCLHRLYPDTHAISLSLTKPPELPVCFSSFPPSTTNRSSWKNCDTTVCLCARIVSLASPIYPLLLSSPHPSICKRSPPFLAHKLSNAPSKSATLSNPSASTPVSASHPSPCCVL